MREILFRGKRIDNGEWVYSQTVFQFLDSFYIPAQNLKCTVTRSLNPVGNISVIRCNRGNYFFKVQTETIGQYTGLTDKNGKKIFEGDIVAAPPQVGCEKTLGVVEFGDYKTQPYGVDETNRGFYIHWCNSNDEISEEIIKELLRRDITFWCKYFHAGIEVIGNIHDNPELLEVEQ